MGVEAVGLRTRKSFKGIRLVWLLGFIGLQDELTISMPCFTEP